ncbi:retrovirus-related pol polyprotein from transposon TNT 1-94, partial [Tanacetum coccineum]
MEVLTKREIADKFFDEHLMVLKSKFNNDEPWYADFVNYIVGKVVPQNWTFKKRKRFFLQVKIYFWEDPYAFKLCADNIMRRCVAGSETLENLAHCHSGPTGEHHNANVTAKKDFMGPFLESRVPKALISDRGTHFCNSHLEKALQRYGVTHKLSMAYHPQSNGQTEVTNRAIKHILKRSVGYNPKEIEHKAHWALKQCNTDLTHASESRLMQLNKLAELRDGAYENTRIYKERTKKWHDSRLHGDKDFKKDDETSFQDEERYEHVGLKSQDHKKTKYYKDDQAKYRRPAECKASAGNEDPLKCKASAGNEDPLKCKASTGNKRPAECKASAGNKGSAECKASAGNLRDPIMTDTVPPIPPPFGANTSIPSSPIRAGNTTDTVNNTTTTNVVQSVVDENLPQLLDSRGGSHVINVPEFDEEDFSSWKDRNHKLEEFCDDKGISQNFSSHCTLEQNGVAERRNRTLIEAARTISIIVKRHGKTAYDVFKGRSPDISYFHVFGCPVYIHNHIDHLGKFDEKDDDGFFLGYSPVAKAFRVFNIRRQEMEETYHVTFTYDPFSSNNISILEGLISADSHHDQDSVSLKDHVEISYASHDQTSEASPTTTLSITNPLSPQDRWSRDKHIELVNIIGEPLDGVTTRSKIRDSEVASAHECLYVNFLSQIKPKRLIEALEEEGWIIAMQEELNQFERNKVWTLVPLPNDKTIIGTKWIYRNKMDEYGIVIKNKARLVAQEYRQE